MWIRATTRRIQPLVTLKIYDHMQIKYGELGYRGKYSSTDYT